MNQNNSTLMYLAAFIGVLFTMVVIVGLQPPVPAGLHGSIPECSAVAGDADHLNFTVGASLLSCGTNYETRPTLEQVTFTGFGATSGAIFSAGQTIYPFDANNLEYYAARHNIRVADRLVTVSTYTEFLVTLGTTFKTDNTATATSTTAAPNIMTGGLAINDNAYVKNEIAFQTSADPATHTGYAQIYSKSAASTAELFVQDDAGNVTQISPHIGDTWIFESTNVFSGKTVKVDMEAAFLALELLSGTEIISVVTDPTIREDWDVSQERIRTDRANEIAEYDRINAECKAQELILDNVLECDSAERPTEYVPVPAPQWLVDSLSRR